MTEEHGIYSGVVDIARNGVDEVIRLRKLNAELVKALRQVEGIINLSPHALSITRTALMKAKLEYENEAR